MEDLPSTRIENLMESLCGEDAVVENIYVNDEAVVAFTYSDGPLVGFISHSGGITNHVIVNTLA